MQNARYITCPRGADVIKAQTEKFKEKFECNSIINKIYYGDSLNKHPSRWLPKVSQIQNFKNSLYPKIGK